MIAGEVGASRRAIPFYGDVVVNRTARLEQATRQIDRQFLVSADALARLELTSHRATGPRPYRLEDLGR